MTARRARSAEEETDHLLRLYENDVPKILDVIQSQFTNVAARAQTLLQLAGLTITVTGFSGASIARSGRLAAILVVSGLVVVLLGASHSLGGILRIRWTTQLAPCSPREAILEAIRMRDHKTRAFSQSLVLLIVGLALYIGSVSLLLLTNLPDR
ncbi:MAG: hypothetical protein BGO98_15295 [Myxococcales bacterium 68-20]|nr:MAG: hypothetical protein BGO98_15295 [Myxococcales bacterium 68-20]